MEINYIVYPYVYPNSGTQNERLSIKTPFDCRKVVLKKEDQYIGWIGNEHHWTTKYVWNKFIPLLCSDLNIRVNPRDYTQVAFSHKNYDLTYHDISKNMDYELTDLDDNNVMYGGTEVMRDIGEQSKIQRWTPYHQLFTLAHKCCIVKNKSIDADRTLVLNTDSMSVPVIPILANYFSCILVIDSRISGKQYGFNEIIHKMNPTHQMNLFLDINCIRHKKYYQIEK